MAMVSIIARPTNSVREMVPAASGCRAMASMAAATDRPSASAGPIEPMDTAMAAPMMETSFASMNTPLGFLCAADGGADEHSRKHGENVRLHDADENLERHERNRHEQPRQSHDERNHELSAHHVSEQTHHERERARHFGKDIERQHDELRFGESGEIAPKSLGSDAVVVHGKEHDERERGWGLDGARRRLYAGQHAGEVRHRDKNEQSAEQR